MTADGNEALREAVERSKDFPLYYNHGTTVMKHARRGGDREIARCYSWDMARTVVRALNLFDTVQRLLRG